MRDRADARSVGPPHLVQHQALAVGETQPHPPVLPRQRVAVQGERRALGLDDLQRPPRGARGVAGDVRRGVLAHHRREAGVRPVLDLQQLHRVHVDDELEPGHRVRVRVGPRGGAQPDVAPADPAAREGLGDQAGPVGPDVDQRQRRVVDAALGQRRDHVGVAAHRLVALVPLVDGRVGLAAGLGFPCQQGVIGPCRHSRGTIPRRTRGRPAVSHTIARATRSTGSPGRCAAHHLLGRLAQLDRGDPPLRAGDAALAAQQRGDPADLVGGQRIQRMGMGHGSASCSARRPQC